MSLSSSYQSSHLNFDLTQELQVLTVKASSTSKDVKLSFIILAQEKLHDIHTTLESIYAQTHENFECIVLMPHEGAIKKSFLEAWLIRSQIRWYTHFSSHIFDSFNRGARLANGHYLYFLYAGDQLIVPGAVEAMMNLALKHHLPDLIYIGTLLENHVADSKACFYEYSTPGLKKIDKRLPLSCCVMLRLNFIHNSRFNPYFKHLADFDWLCRMNKKVGFRSVCEQFVLIRSSAQVDFSFSFEHLKELTIILTKNFGFLSALYSLLSYLLIPNFIKWIMSQTLMFIKQSFFGRYLSEKKR